MSYSRKADSIGESRQTTADESSVSAPVNKSQKQATHSGPQVESGLNRDFSTVPAAAGPSVEPLPAMRTHLSIQRLPGNESSEQAAPSGGAESETATTPDSESESASPEATPAAGWIVEDDAAEPGPGQMRKSEFLSQLRGVVCSTIDSAIAGSGRNTEGCPYVSNWINYYARQSTAHLVRGIHRYAPEAASSTSAADYISVINQRVQRAAETWARTGEITGVPEGVPQTPPGTAAQGASGGGVQRKARQGGSEPNGTHTGADPQSVRKQLGTGQPLESGVRSRMENAFGMDFSHVRTHSDTNAAEMSADFNARAFTVGEHISFGTGEYQPGTPTGDAIIAHEIAHVVQQNSGSASVSPMKEGETQLDSLEEDADQSAVGALVSVFSSAGQQTTQIAGNAMPRLRSGLKLQRCDDCSGTRTPTRPRTPRYVTNVGTYLVTSRSGVSSSVPDMTQTQADAALASIGMTGRVTQTAPATNSYNCHGYTFTNSARWLSDDQVPTILTENGYSVTTTPSVGDIAVYRFEGSIVHTGVITAVSGTTITEVHSKWGRAPRYRHAPADVPPIYGTYTAYTTSRSGGHLLRTSP